jgi:hypothetical protein
MTFTAGFYIGAGWLLLLAGGLWASSPRRRRLRRALAPVVHTVIGAAIRVGLID